MDEIQCVAVSGHFLFVAVLQRGVPENNRADASLVDLDALDSIRRHGALGDGVFAQNLQLLGGLACEEFLQAMRMAYVG
jgi:hypothetical protein